MRGQAWQASLAGYRCVKLRNSSRLVRSLVRSELGAGGHRSQRSGIGP